MVVADRSRRRTTAFLSLTVFIAFIIFSLSSESTILARYHQSVSIPQIITTDDRKNRLSSKNSSIVNTNINNISGSSTASSDRCSRILLYDTELVAKDTGVGHRLASYALASVVSVLEDSALILLEPPLEDEHNTWINFGGSPFGCPVIKNDGSCDGLPTGLSRIVQNSAMLSRGCDVPMNLTCAIANQNRSFTIQTYQDWSRISNRTTRQLGFQEVSCNDHDGNNKVSVLAIGGYQMKFYFLAKVRPRLVQRFWDESNSTKRRRMKWEQWMESWSTRMGATIEEVHEYTRANGIINNRKNDDNSYVEEYSLVDYLNAVLNRAEVPMFQPWVVKDIATYMRKIGLPQPSSSKRSLFHNEGGGYDAMHIRRGDSLTRSQSIRATEEYWMQNGYPARDNKTDNIETLSIYPTNFIPTVKYWEQYITYNSNCNLHNTFASVQKIYIATDDISTVKSEIANLTSINGQHFWTVCNKSVEFIFNPQEEHTTHLHQHLAPNAILRSGVNTTSSGYEQYSRALAALVDLQILARSDVFVGDDRSYVSRLLWMLRTSFQDDHPARAHTRTRDIVMAWGVNVKQPPWK